MNSHQDNGKGWCVACGCAFPCPQSDAANEMVGDAMRPRSRRRRKGWLV